MSDVPGMSRREMEDRLKAFALRVLDLTKALPDDYRGRSMGSQVFRSATSVAANYRAAGRGKSKADFIAKLGIVQEEADETCFWLELIIEGGFVKASRVEPLLAEANEITAIITASLKSAKRRKL
ncbi:MAG: four helix bundle protein [Planctomycetota bacterium]